MRIVLINMPFAALATPSLALAQLASVLKGTFRKRIRVETLYLNMDFAAHVGDLSLYHYPLSDHGFMTDAGDWLFRQVAFPDTPDNSAEYLARYYFESDAAVQKARKFLEKQRKGLDRVLDGFIDKYRLLDADIVGFTLLFCQTVPSLAMARRLKDRNPAITTILGGSACEGEAGHVLAACCPQIDYVFSGPALVSLPGFVRGRLAGSNAACERINGVFSNSNQASWMHGKTGEPPRRGIAIVGDELDINADIRPDYSGFLDTLEKNFPGKCVSPVLLFETSRGCAWGEHSRCKFCGLNGIDRSHRAMAPEKAVKHLRWLFRYVPRAHYFVGVDNALPDCYIEEVFPKLPLPGNGTIRYEIRPTLTEEEIGALCRAGVTRAQPGLESLATSTLRRMRKGTTAFRNLQFLKACTRHPLSIEWNLLVGSPGEPETVYAKYLHDIPLMSHLPPPTGAYPVMFVRHSEYFDHAAKYGLDLRPQDFYELIFPFGRDNIRRMAYHFVDNNADAERLNLWLDRLNGAVSAWRTRWFNGDGKIQSRLCFLDHGAEPTIYDSRSGVAVEHRLSSATKRVLDVLEKPATRAGLAARFAFRLPALDVDHELAVLNERGLLFEEEGRFLSLVAG